MSSCESWSATSRITGPSDGREGSHVAKTRKAPSRTCGSLSPRTAERCRRLELGRWLTKHGSTRRGETNGRRWIGREPARDDRVGVRNAHDLERLDGSFRWWPAGSA